MRYAAAIADVAEDGPLRAQHQRSAGRSHAVEVAIERASLVDSGVGRFEGPLEHVDHVQVTEFEERVADGVGGNLAGKLADGMSPHAVSHH